MNKKLVALVGSVVMLGGVVAGAASCGKRDKSEFTVAYLAGGRGESYVENWWRALKRPITSSSI